MSGTPPNRGLNSNFIQDSRYHIQLGSELTEQQFAAQLGYDDLSNESGQEQILNEIQDIPEVEPTHLQYQLAQQVEDQVLMVGRQRSLQYPLEQGYQMQSMQMMGMSTNFGGDDYNWNNGYDEKLNTMFPIEDNSDRFNSQHFHDQEQQNMMYFQCKNLQFIPPQQLQNLKICKVDLVLINMINNQTYAFDQQEIELDDQKRYDINFVIQLEIISSFISKDSCFYKKLDGEINQMYLGKHPILDSDKRYHQLDKNGMITLKFQPKLDTLGEFKKGYTIIKVDNGQNEIDINEEKRVNERSVKEALQHVTLWRKMYIEANRKLPQGYKQITLENVAKSYQHCKKKTLDYYFQEIRKAESFMYKFKENLESKMGSLRQFNQQNADNMKKQGATKDDRSKEIHFQLNQEDMLPLDEEIVAKLIENAVSKKTNKMFPPKESFHQQGQQRSPLNSLTQDTQFENENRPEKKNELHIQKTKVIVKQKINISPAKNIMRTSRTSPNSQVSHPFKFRLLRESDEQQKGGEQYSKIQSPQQPNEPYQASRSPQIFNVPESNWMNGTQEQIINGQKEWDSVSMSEYKQETGLIQGSEQLSNVSPKKYFGQNSNNYHFQNIISQPELSIQQNNNNFSFNQDQFNQTDLKINQESDPLVCIKQCCNSDRLFKTDSNIFTQNR